MSNRKAWISAAVVATVLATAVAQAGPIGPTGACGKTQHPRPALVSDGPDAGPLAPAFVDVAGLPQDGPATEGRGAGEPALMGLLGIGISGMIALRRIRKYFF